jgi:hypothetical protein
VCQIPPGDLWVHADCGQSSTGCCCRTALLRCEVLVTTHSVTTCKGTTKYRKPQHQAHVTGVNRRPVVLARARREEEKKGSPCVHRVRHGADPLHTVTRTGCRYCPLMPSTTDNMHRWCAPVYPAPPAVYGTHTHCMHLCWTQEMHAEPGCAQVPAAFKAQCNRYYQN